MRPEKSKIKFMHSNANVNEDNQYCNFAVQGRDSELMRSYTRSREALIRMPVRLTSRKLIRQSKVKLLRNREPSRVYIIEFLRHFQGEI